MSRRFFVETPIETDEVLLAGSEAHHLIHVMRAKAGDEVVLFDGSGAEFSAHVAQIGRNEVRCEVVSRTEIDRELPFQLTLGVALPKGERQRWLVEKAVELGVTEIVPLVTARSVAQPTGHAIARLKRAVIEASKQCGRNCLMRIGPPAPLNQYLANTGIDELCLIAIPDSESRQLGGSRNSYRIAIGPEGGFTGEEIHQARDSGWQSYSLGPRILRTETAALALTSVIVNID